MKQLKIVMFTGLLAVSLTKPNQAAPDKAAPSRAARISKVFVVGKVQKPGAYSFSGQWRLLDAIASAGGMTAKPESLRLSMQRGVSKVSIDMSKSLPMNDAANLTLRSGDVITVVAADAIVEPTVPPQWLNPRPELGQRRLREGDKFSFNGTIVRIVPLSKNRVTQKQE